jgi:hypothetical protein
MLDAPFTPPHSPYGDTGAVLLILFVLVRLGHRVLDLGRHALAFLRDYRDFRDGY